MTHYVCSECKSTSQHAGTCQLEECIQQGVALKECRCEDDKHVGVVSMSSSEEGDTPDSGEAPPTTIDLDS